MAGHSTNNATIHLIVKYETITQTYFNSKSQVSQVKSSSPLKVTVLG